MTISAASNYPRIVKEALAIVSQEAGQPIPLSDLRLVGYFYDYPSNTARSGLGYLLPGDPTEHGCARVLFFATEDLTELAKWDKSRRREI